MNSTSSGASSTLPVVSCTRAMADFVGSVTDVAVTVTVAFSGKASGAVYVLAAPSGVAESDKEPHASLQAASSCASVHSTPLNVGSKPTLPVNGCVTPSGMRALTGVTCTPIAATRTTAEPCTDGPLTALAVSVTSSSDGGALAGAT